MSDKEQNPAAQPDGGYQRQDSSSTAVPDGGPPHKKNRTRCLLYIILFIIFQTGIILVFILAIMKVRTPKFRLRSGTLQNVTTSAAANASFAARVTAELSVGNANFGRYKYRSTTVAFFYRGAQVGAADVVKSSVSWRSTKRFEVSAELDLGTAKRDGELAADMRAGVLSVMSRARMAGKVEVVFVMKKKRSTDLECTMEIVTTSSELRNVVCK